MNRHNTASFQKGFTLVEMAIVMVIIGLLIGGILKGQEILAATKINTTVKEIQAIDGAFSLFYQKYGMLPGDMTTPATFLPNCTGACNQAGDNDENYEAQYQAALASTDERFTAFIHLAAAGLVSGIENTATIEVGRSVMPSAVGGAYTVGTFGANTTSPNFYQGGSYLGMIKSIATDGTIGRNPIMTSSVAAIDRKIDDGKAKTGLLIITSCAACYDAVAGTYNENYTTTATEFMYKLNVP
ncbi:MAG: prepilin-type N-terminal cleavage/methylation domain-containing protein [Alphaproteobacteria bacterium]|nr:prepilin-type N-terminal cleavage/methylation domain-containing protein [Alphaproteobacteria bacterium]